MKKCLIYICVFFSLIDFLKAQNSEKCHIDSLLHYKKMEVFNKSSRIPFSIRKYLNEKGGRRIKFDTKNKATDVRIRKRVFVFALKCQHEWLIYYIHGRKDTHRHLIYIALVGSKVCHYANYRYSGKETSFEKFKENACISCHLLEVLYDEKDL